ncbi:cache domain-containing sensor histidine kinase [Paenibacillus fonticola]|uniref:cache domain-containing sensor histidine kinase n=1 Tax=Paenibacillus fonticola TaxID=379896 RepID=UPI000381B463|nr:sensor histidine kinase [Paenibacillus fonticola]
MIKLRNKMLLYYFLLLVITVTITGVAYKEINSRILIDKVVQVNHQSINLVRENVLLTLDTVNNYSKMLLANETVQSNLRYPDNVTLADIRRTDLYLLEFLDSAPLLNSIYVYDLNGNRYTGDKTGVKNLVFSDLKKNGFLDRALALRGTPFTELNAGGLLKPDAGNMVSLIRVINDTDTLKPIGLVVINVDSADILPSFERMGAPTQSYIELVNDSRQQISISGGHLKPHHFPETQLPAKEGYVIEKYSDMNYLVSYTPIQAFGWSIVSAVPFSDVSKENKLFQLTTVGLLLFNGALLFIGSLVISRFVTVPIGELVSSMRKVHNGHFTELKFKATSYEMTALRDGYNVMIKEIQALINQIIDKQKRLRNAELNVIQAQIKPHFLYNAFDAISSLSFAGRTELVYDMVKSLGTYYCHSLNSGNEIITLGKEIEIVKSYIKIQNIRYRDLVHLEIDIDERFIGLPILKLVLQPLVENALYHGIKPKGKAGQITITAKKAGDRLRLTVEDNGIGMDLAEKAAHRSASRAQNDERAGFGLSSTIERLSLFYDADNIVTVDSTPGQGTLITILIPLTGRDKNDSIDD